MSKSSLGSDDFVIAARNDRSPAEDAAVEPGTANRLHRRRQVKPPDKTLPRLSDEERREKQTKRALVQGDARLALKQLRRAKEREAKFYVNVALSYDLKTRLKTAAHENDINMTVIMQAAIETYLDENGY